MRLICKLIRIGRWSEPRFVFVCQLVEVIRETDSNEISGKNGVALLGSHSVDESQLRIPKFEPDIMFYNMVPLVSIVGPVFWCISPESGRRSLGREESEGRSDFDE